VIIRRAPGEAADGQVLAVNVDLALITEPLPDPNERRLERFAALATSGGAPVALVLTKADLDEEGYAKATQLGRRLGAADAVAVSVRTGEGIDVIRGLLDPGATAVLLGASGTGKSTLINTLLGEDRQKTGEIRADGRGRHTTVTRELLTLPGGAFLIDTPGIRIAGLWEGVGDTFADVEELALGCRFSDCGHTTEPGCAVRAGLPAERIEAWRKLQEELASIDDRRAKSRR
jgi:ribosome biogenesis GTPase